MSGLRIRCPRPAFRSLARWFLVFSILACSPQDAPPDRDPSGTSPEQAPVAEWTLTREPLLEIGVAEGDEAYQFHRVAGSVRLGSGGILVLNTGSQQLRLFDETGTYVRAIGREGEGPGEFRDPTRIRTLAPDSIVVWDRELRRISFFDARGEFLGARRLLPSPTQLFPGDEWLYGRNWIDSPVSPSGRDVIRNAVDALPTADTTRTVRYLRVADDGWIWMADRRPPADSAIDWRIYDLRGRPVARIRTPPRFQPHEIGPDYMLGRYQDDLDLNYVRLYGLEKPVGTPEAPGIRTSIGPGIPEDEPVGGPEIPREVLAGIRSLVKNMASLQEIYYSEHYTYTTDVGALFQNSRGGLPDGIDVQILFAGNDGWMGTFTHEKTGAMCGLAYGYYVPMGWMPGAVICP